MQRRPSCHRSQGYSGRAVSWDVHRQGERSPSVHRWGFLRVFFTITSGSNTISGTFDSDRGVTGGCSRGGGACGAGPLTYSATLEPGGKILSGKGSGVLDSDNDPGTMSLKLRHM